VPRPLSSGPSSRIVEIAVTPSKHSLVIATSNRGKLEEFRALLAGLNVRVHTMEEVVGKRLNIVENGATFIDNALIKARAVASASMMLTLADDSGLEVDALGGAPGTRSARYAHERATDAENNAALLSALAALPEAIPEEGTPARFCCALVVIDPYAPRAEGASIFPGADGEVDTGGAHGEPIVVEGKCEGRVTPQARGSGGFGYDPLFVVDGMGKTLAELTEAEKNEVSHRARAFAELRPRLAALLAARDEEIARIVSR
jgi:XTP/dITP diphosphohydrolase